MTRLPRFVSAAIAATLVGGLAALVTFDLLTNGTSAQEPGPVRVASVPLAVPAPTGSPASADGCSLLIGQLPAALGERLPARPVTSDAAAAAWGGEGEPPVVLRCGVERPAGFRLGAEEVPEVEGVVWFSDIGTDVVTWTAVDRGTYLELSVPVTIEGQGALLARLAPAVKSALPERPLDPAPVPTGAP